MKTSPAIALGEISSLTVADRALGCHRSADIKRVKQLDSEIMQPLNQKEVSLGRSMMR